MRKFVAVLSIAVGSLAIVPSAHAVIPSVLGGDVPCTVAGDGVRECGKVGTNEVAELNITATGGTYTLTVGADTTGPLAYNASTAAVDGALEGLLAVGSGGATVTDPAPAGFPYVITFTGSVARTPMPDITIDATGLTGGGGTTNVTTQGEYPTATDETFDGSPVDINIAFPPDPGGSDGPYPLIVWGHGYGGAKLGLGTSGSTTSGFRRFTSRGYAVMSMTTRGFRESCGSPNSKRRWGSACDNGYVRLMDDRYEVRDYQDLAGELVDQGLVQPTKIGAVGGSYGGGLSMALGALKNRQMMPDGSLVPWESPTGNTPMSMAAAVPNIPWTDLSYSLVPNGRTLDYVTDNDYGSRVGVMKQSLVNGLYLSGLTAPGFYSNTDPNANLNGWLTRLTAGEPYDGDPTATNIVSEIQQHHSSYYIDPSVAPAPMLMSSGFTDDLFPADETIRYYNRTRVQHPNTPLALYFGDFGHQRSANKADVSSALVARENAWLDFYVRGVGSTPQAGATAYTQTCPDNSGAPGIPGAPSGGPFAASTWAGIAPGEMRLSDATPRTMAADSGDPTVGARFDPAQTGSEACRTNSAVTEAGSVNYSLPAMTSPATLLGATTVISDIQSGSNNNAITARLFDVLPNGTERLVARGLWRPAASGRQVFQLHPNGYQFGAGSVPRITLTARDSGGGPLNSYGRPANGQTAITFSNTEIRLPTADKPGAAGGAVKVPRDKVVPAGRTISPEFAAISNDANASIGGGKLKAKGKTVTVSVGAPGSWESAHAKVSIYSGAPPAGASAAKAQLLGTATATIRGGETGKVKVKLNKAGKKLAKKGGKKKVTVLVSTAEQDGSVTAKKTAVFKKAKKKKKGKK